MGGVTVRRATLLVVVGLASLLLGACLLPGSTPPVIKIGLIAPFEGPSRPLGYSVLNGVRLRLQQWNEAGHSPRVELVALNDNGDPDLAVQLPAQLAIDPDVLLVLGPPQGHTALAVLPELSKHELPALSLAPLPDDSSMWVVPFAGVDADLQAALARYGLDGPVMRQQPLAGPSIWVGDPQTLAEIVSTMPDMILAAGVVAIEPAFAAWAGAASNGMIWASATPENLSADFADSFQVLTGSPHQQISALAYAATDHALSMMTEHTERATLRSAIQDHPTMPIQVYQRQGADCCVPLTPDPQ